MEIIEHIENDVIVLELGMDGLSYDPLAHLNLTNNVYADIINKIMELDIPILAVGGGGYHVENTARGWALAWTILNGAEAQDEWNTVGMGGVMLQTSDWQGGLRDRALLTHGGQRKLVDQAIDETIEKLKTNLFSIHGL